MRHSITLLTLTWRLHLTLVKSVFKARTPLLWSRSRFTLLFGLIITSGALGLSGCDKEKPRGSLEGEDVDFGDGGQGCVFDEDNTYADGNRLELDQIAQDFVCPLGDSDWYQMTLDRAGIVSVKASMETDLSPINLMYELYKVVDGETREIVAQSLASEAATRLQTSHCVAGGSHGLRIFDLNGDGQDKRNLYELEVSLRDDPDSGEIADEGPPSGVRPGEVPAGETPEINARELVAGEDAEGYLACRGDEDWYTFEVPPRSILTFSLAMELTAVQPRVTLLDASLTPVVALNNASAQMNTTELTRDLSLTEGGRYYLLVADSSGIRTDLETPYTISIEIREDTDQNEPNNYPDLATDLSATPLECGDEWSEWIERDGVVGTLGDIDWFGLEVSGCGRGLIEVELELDDSEFTPSESFALQRGLGLSVSLVESHEPTMCEFGANGADESCRKLTQSCGRPWDCAGLSLVCLPEGVCAGSASCLPNGRCASTKIERHYLLPDGATELALPRHRVRLSAPLSSDVRRYLRVGDYGGNAADPRAQYKLRVRTRRDPDIHEPSNVYTDEIRRGDDNGAHINLARGSNKVLVHDCSEGIFAPEPEPDDEEKRLDKNAGEMAGAEAGEMAGVDAGMMASDMAGTMAGASAGVPAGMTAGSEMGGMSGGEIAGDVAGEMSGEMSGEMTGGTEPVQPVNGLLPTCCSSPEAVWTEGVISYEDDQDFYAYRHPCPGQDCMVKIYYEIDEGPVDLLWQVYQGDNLWFDPIVPVSELAVNAGISGSFGGLEAGDSCFYAWQGHGGDNFFYTLSIRDLRPTRDWSTEQRYRFCIEKAGNGCFEPPCRNRAQPESGRQDGGCSIR